MAIAQSLASTTTLNDGTIIPMFGLGTYNSQHGEGGDAEKAVIQALNSGYKLIDTADFHSNETDVGRAIKLSGKRQDDVYIITKIWEHGEDVCKQTIRNALNNLGTNYIDMYVIHAPIGGRLVETYRAMIQMKEEGIIRSCGVANFGVQHLEGLHDAGLPAPSVNQLELHPWQQKKDIVSYCDANRIGLMAYCPVTRGKMLHEPKITEMANRYNKSPAQLLLRWSIQRGFIPLPKSVSPQRIAENSQVFDWQIKQDDMNKLNACPNWSCAWNPTTCPWMG